MATESRTSTTRQHAGVVVLVLILSTVGVFAAGRWWPQEEGSAAARPRLNYLPRGQMDTSGFSTVASNVSPWDPSAPLEKVAAAWKGAGYRFCQMIDNDIRAGVLSEDDAIRVRLIKASVLNFEGEPDRAYAVLGETRGLVEADTRLAEHYLFSVIAFQGVTALRRGETDNCVMCRAESSCILPISAAAVHTRPEGSRLAVAHFTEYLDQFPDDLEIRWLLNVAHMTLGEHPHGVNPRFLVTLDRYNSPEHGIGRFRDVGHLVGINRFNQAGGAVLDDFDNDGRLDVVFTSFDPAASMAFYRNKGDGTFEDRTKEAGLLDQLGGLNCAQADYDNDGFLDLYITRGAWIHHPIRPSLMRNNGNGTFTDVTREAGVLDPVNSITAQWEDYDNDGWLDLFVACERQPNRLYRNKGDGTFEEVAYRAGVSLPGGKWKGIAWLDYDGDRHPDLFLNNLEGTAVLCRNKGDGTFENATKSAGIRAPQHGFSCWAFDYDNDGRPDIFATSYEHTVADAVRGLRGEPHTLQAPTRNALYRNVGGHRFEDVTAEAGLDQVFAAMGSNFGDFDNDGWLDFYLGTGNPQFSTLVPNRMFRNLGGKRFAEITGSSGTGHLQKGHGVACGDWDRDGSTDVVIQMGGAVNGDRYHNILFQNPGQGNNWLSVKLVGTKSNRSAIGARVKVVTAGDHPRTVYRWVSSGSSFGANPLEQSIGLGQADRVAALEVYWPTTGQTQTFRDVPANQFIEVTESAPDYRKRDLKPIPLPR